MYIDPSVIKNTVEKYDAKLKSIQTSIEAIMDSVNNTMAQAMATVGSGEGIFESFQAQMQGFKDTQFDTIMANVASWKSFMSEVLTEWESAQTKGKGFFEG